VIDKTALTSPPDCLSQKSASCSTLDYGSENATLTANVGQFMDLLEGESLSVHPRILEALRRVDLSSFLLDNIIYLD
jgi:hypothetical protein